jgi:protein-disulfide isomerase
MHRYLSCIFLIFLLAALTGVQPAISQNAKSDSVALPSEETVNAFMHETFGYDPSLNWKVSSIKPSEAAGLAEVDVVISGPQGAQSQKFYVSADGKHAVIGSILPFGVHPFDATRKELEKGITGPSRGPADAPVTIVEFSDLQCPHCKEAQPTINKLMSENKNVRLVFQNFPLPMHDWAARGAAYADCVGRSSNDAFWKFIDGVYDAQSEITAANADEKLTGIADKSGVKGSDVAACAAKPDTATRVEHSQALGKSVDVNQTPTFFINGRNVPNVSYDTLAKLVDFAAKQPK